MFQNPKVTQGQAFPLDFSSAVKLELSQRFCLSSLAELPSACGQSLLGRVWIRGAARFSQLFSSLGSSADSCCLEVLIRKEEIPKLSFFTTRNPFPSLHFLVHFFSPLLFHFFFFSRFPCEYLSERLVPQRSVEGDLQWILSKKRTAQVYAGTAERGLAISWEQGFLTEELFRAKTF